MAWLFGLIALVTAVFEFTHSANAEIPWTYVKPSSEHSVGQWLTDILGLSDFGRDYAVIVGLSGFEQIQPARCNER